MDVRRSPVSDDGEGGLRSGDRSGFPQMFNPSDPCTYSTIRKYKCFVDGSSSSGSPVQRCERTEQVLRRCPGRPVEVVESETEYTHGDAANGSTNFWDRNSERALRQPRGFQQQPWSTGPMPSGEPDWPRGFTQGDYRRNFPGAGAFSGFGAVMDAIEDVVRETEGMAHSLLHAFGLEGDETSKSGNPFDHLFGGDIFGGSERRPQGRGDSDPTTRSTQSTTSKPDMFDPSDFREV